MVLLDSHCPHHQFYLTFQMVTSGTNSWIYLCTEDPFHPPLEATMQSVCSNHICRTDWEKPPELCSLAIWRKYIKWGGPGREHLIPSHRLEGAGISRDWENVTPEENIEFSERSFVRTFGGRDSFVAICVCTRPVIYLSFSGRVVLFIFPQRRRKGGGSFAR